jgi:hypothetical protein
LNRSLCNVLLGFTVFGFLLFLPGETRTGVNPLVQGDGSFVFDGGLTEDILSAGDELLTIEYANVIDNGEGRWPPHGPYGSIHVIVYRPEQLLEAPWSPVLELYETMLYGPHQTIGDLFEWLDDEELFYVNYALYDWSWYGLDRVILRFYESDPGLGREHDDLLAVLVSREETTEQAVTFRSDQMEVRLRTRSFQW